MAPRESISVAEMLAVPWARHGQPIENGGQGFAEGWIEDGPVFVREQGQEFNRVVGRIDEVPHSPRAVDRDRLERVLSRYCTVVPRIGIELKLKRQRWRFATGPLPGCETGAMSFGK